MAVTYAVEGMSCDGCRSSVEMMLSRLVSSVRVTLDPAEAVLSGGQAEDVSALNAALAKGGYALTPKAAPAAQGQGQ